jgi:hypothetical protein
MTVLMFFQVLINGLQHIVSGNVKPKMQIVDAFIKVPRSNLVQASLYCISKLMLRRQLRRTHVSAVLLYSANCSYPMCFSSLN